MKKIIAAIGTIFFIAFFLSNCSHEKTESILVIAHRGASGYLPEHTLPGVALAHGMGAHYIEQDVVLTKDNIPVVLHDHFLDTVTNVAEIFQNRKRKDGRYYAIDFTLEELRRLSVNERIDRNSKKAVFPDRFPIQTEKLHKGNARIKHLQYQRWKKNCF